MLNNQIAFGGIADPERIKKSYEYYAIRHAGHSLLAMVHLVQLPEGGVSSAVGSGVYITSPNLINLTRTLTLALIMAHLMLSETSALRRKLPRCLANPLSAPLFPFALHAFLTALWFLDLTILDWVGVPLLSRVCLLPIFLIVSNLQVALMNFNFFPIILSMAQC